MNSTTKNGGEVIKESIKNSATPIGDHIKEAADAAVKTADEVVDNTLENFQAWLSKVGELVDSTVAMAKRHPTAAWGIGGIIALYAIKCAAVGSKEKD